MDNKLLRDILNKYKAEEITEDECLKSLATLPYKDLGYAKIDNHREIRTGYPEVIFCQNKKPEHIKGIVKSILNSGGENVLLTRLTKDIFKEIEKEIENIEYFEDAKIAVANRVFRQFSNSKIAIIAAGTSDYPVAEEAAITAEVLGNKVIRLYDVGVAGIHRLFSKIDIIHEAKVIICVAGMEGALLSVVGGIAKAPVIGVPTSVGYGANFGGLSALLAMLNSCASGSSVVNIDNGFGAAYLASMINRIGE
ncbi:MAG: nickel pincer cofactor biosynthesis protein LarB [Tissierellia bacterium]|nr:nickel pincer cofactor biosynthesis protein LarB [Tissierellia bacterium]